MAHAHPLTTLHNNDDTTTHGDYDDDNNNNNNNTERYPQSTESKILKEYITLSANRAETQLAPPSAVTNAVSWRPPGIKHRKNEIFLDVVESLDLLVSSNGTVLHSEILGAVKMRSCGVCVVIAIRCLRRGRRSLCATCCARFVAVGRC